MNPEQNQPAGTNAQQPSQSATPIARPCPQDCARCTPWQQIYCVTRMTCDVTVAMNNMRDQLAATKQEIEQLKSLLTPASDQFIDPTAQMESGA